MTIPATRTITADRLAELNVEDLDHLRRRLGDLEDAHADWKTRSGLGLMLIGTLAGVAAVKAGEARPAYCNHTWLQHQIDDVTRRIHLHIHPEEINHQ